MKDTNIININDLENVVRTAANSGYSVSITINGEYYDIDTNKPKYEVYKTWEGYKIIRKGSHGPGWYLKSIRNGKAVWSTDYLYARHYTTREGAIKAIESIKEV